MSKRTSNDNAYNEFLERWTNPDASEFEDRGDIEMDGVSEEGFKENEDDNQAFLAAVRSGKGFGSHTSSEPLTGLAAEERDGLPPYRPRFAELAKGVKNNKRVRKRYDRLVEKGGFSPDERGELLRLRKAFFSFPEKEGLRQEEFFATHLAELNTYRLLADGTFLGVKPGEVLRLSDSPSDEEDPDVVIPDFDDVELDEEVLLEEGEAEKRNKTPLKLHCFAGIDAEWNDEHLISVQLHFAGYDPDNPPSDEKVFLEKNKFTMVFINSIYEGKLDLPKTYFCGEVNGYRCEYAPIRYVDMSLLEKSRTELAREQLGLNDPNDDKNLFLIFLEEKVPNLFSIAYDKWYTRCYLPTVDPEIKKKHFFIPNIKLIMFFAVKDLVAGFSLARIEPFFFEKNQSRTLGGLKEGLRQYKVVIGSMNMPFYWKDKTTKGYKSKSHKILICDLFGLTTGGLESFANMLGAKMSAKGDLDAFKKEMGVALVKHTQTFLEYAVGDVFILFQCYFRMKKKIDEIMLDTMGLPEESLFPFHRYPSTVGRLTSSVFKKHLETLSPDYGRLGVLASFRKYGVLKDDISASDLVRLKCANVEQVKELRQNLFFSGDLILDKLKNHLKFTERGRPPPEDEPPEFFFTKAELYLIECENLYVHTGVSHANAYTWLTQTKVNFTHFLNWAVSGGRAANDRHREYTLDYVLDVDLQSCYGSSIASLVYPLGIPTMLGQYSQTPLSQYPTLKQYANKYLKDDEDLKKGEDLKDDKDPKDDKDLKKGEDPKDDKDLKDDEEKKKKKKNEHKATIAPWHMVVSTVKDLPFHQTLIPSKIVSNHQIEKVKNLSSQTSIYDLEDVPTNFFTVTKQIHNGIITPHVYNILKKVCTNKEKTHFDELRVKSACFWLDKHCCETMDEYIKQVLIAKGDFSVDADRQTIQDDRPRCWFAVKLEGFIGKLVSQRNTAKNMSKKAPPEKRPEFKALSDVLKLFINSFYGVCCSRFFDVGNTTLANVITAKARSAVWLLSRCLYITQTITDGGIYSPTKVLFFKEGSKKKPGMDFFSDGLYAGKTHKSVYFGPLAGKDWKTFYDTKDFDNECFSAAFLDKGEGAKAHFDKFWKHYDQIPPSD